MKKRFMLAMFAGMPLLASAATQLYLFDFIQGRQTGPAYHQLIAGHDFPAWVEQGGTSTPAETITIKGETWQVLSGCKPHNCPAQAIAVLYSPQTGNMHGVYSDYDEKSDRQTLTWLNLSATDDAGVRNILYTRLNGPVLR